jgi:hypothetical protein
MCRRVCAAFPMEPSGLRSGLDICEFLDVALRRPGPETRLRRQLTIFGTDGGTGLI